MHFKAAKGVVKLAALLAALNFTTSAPPPSDGLPMDPGPVMRAFLIDGPIIRL
jgi:hypothetical protein